MYYKKNNFIHKCIFSTNHKDIIILDLIFLGLMLSILMRIELATPGNGIFESNFQLYSSILTTNISIMDKSKFKEKFFAFQKFKEKFPGVSIGLDILDELNSRKFKKINALDKKIILDNNYNGIDYTVYFYDFKEDSLNELSLIDLNNELHYIYNEFYIKEKIVLYNELYYLFCYNYNKIYIKYNYDYSNSVFCNLDIINKFIHGLRKNLDKTSYKFDINEVIRVFDRNYFDAKISNEQFYVFLLDFIYTLSENKILEINTIENTFIFNEKYKDNLLRLIYCSFEIPVLGNNKIFDVYNLSEDNVLLNLNRVNKIYDTSSYESNLYINDLLVSLVLCSCVSEVSSDRNLNNIFIEAAKK